MSSEASETSQQLGIVPYLRSSRSRANEGAEPGMTSPNLIMTSLGTQSMATNQTQASTPLIVSISREHTPFKPLPRPTPTASAAHHAPSAYKLGGVAGANVGSYGAGGGDSRSKVLQTLAKKISQKSKKVSSNLNSLRVAGGPGARGHTHPQQQHAASVQSDASRGITCPSCGKTNTQHKKRCGYCLEFMVGTACPSCSSLNYYHAKTCYKCGASMPWGEGEEPPLPPAMPITSAAAKNQASASYEQVSREGGVTETASDSSSHPTSPLSPKFSAPPIRSAVLKSMFPQVSNL